MSDYSLDVDREAVQLDGNWFTAEELATKVTEMLGNKDFRIGQAASALEALQAALADVRDIGFRLPGTMLTALENTAGKEGRTTSAILRDSLQTYLEAKGESAGVPVLGPAEGGAPTPVAAGANPPSPGAEGASGVTVETISPSDDDAAAAVPLTAKKKDGEADSPESNWFGKK